MRLASHRSSQVFDPIASIPSPAAIDLIMLRHLASVNRFTSASSRIWNASQFAVVGSFRRGNRPTIASLPFFAAFLTIFLMPVADLYLSFTDVLFP